MSVKLLFIGEARGAQEERLGTSFVGPSGAELLRMSAEAGVITFSAADTDYIRNFYSTGDPKLIDAVWRLHPEIARANVFERHPPANDITTFCGSKTDGIKGLPALTKSKYVLPEYEPELDRLRGVIEHLNPNLIVALGNTPLWATCGVTAISKLRGSTRVATHIGAGRKVLPIYHPAAVLREWSLRPITIIDLEKAAREQEFADVRRPRREIWIEPDLSDIERFWRDHIIGCACLSVDIETSGTRVTCIGFAPSRALALVVPFDDDRAKGRSYWTSGRDERQAWNLVRAILEDSTIPKLFQNGLYDIAFLWRSYGIKTLGAAEDSMLAHHALQPESNKGLGFLGSLYSDEGAWKTERPKTKYTELKRDN